MDINTKRMNTAAPTAKSKERTTLLTYDEALKLILQECGKEKPKTELVPLDQAAFRVLAEPLKAPFDLPRFNNSAVDGYGVIVDDLQDCDKTPRTLKLIDTVSAGDTNCLSELKSGQCIKIMTGAVVPDAVEAVVMREFCQEEEAGVVTVNCRARIGENIRMTGEEMEKDQTVLDAGVKLTPPALGLAATVGKAQINCYKQPRIAIVSTGDELKEPGQELSDSQIYNSNSYAIRACLTGMHFHKQSGATGNSLVSCLHTNDDRESVDATLQKALETSDVIITLGGVSMGDRDYVKVSLEEKGVRTVFWKVAIKPGKPVYFAVAPGGKFIFGLPGNPVSALVTFELFVKPALKILQGEKSAAPHVVSARLQAALKKKAGRLDFVRANLAANDSSPSEQDQTWKPPYLATPTRGQDSHMLTGLVKADALIHFAQELEYAPEGAEVKAQILNW
ncbi:MAG: molybdopterin molybdotransferase MoeA [Candidatus Melainabacteria bacterium]|nr:molybdopterin molybdotransferase MoeA [Candidatus Melainabacteria bacterium]